MISPSNHHIKPTIVALFFISFLILGLSIVKDYGVHWDEFLNHDFGYRWYRYAYGVIFQDKAITPIENEQQQDIIHGPVIEMAFAFIADKLLKFTDSKDIIYFRHAGTWLIFYIGVFFFYLLCTFHFNSWEIGLLGCLLLILHPRIFSHSFYDSLDISNLSFYIISLYTLIRYLEKKTASRAAIHALSCAILIDIRSVGLILPFFTAIAFSLDLLKPTGRKHQLGKNIRNMVFYIVLLLVFITLFWPYLWRNPLFCFLEVMKQTPRILCGHTVLYLGEFIKATSLPWHYIPVWILITTPLTITICFVIGVTTLFAKAVTGPIRFCICNRNDVIFLMAFFLPLMLVIAFKSVLYDSWRHLFFIYPVFVILSLTGISTMYTYIQDNFFGRFRSVLKVSVICMIAANLVYTAFLMRTYHPHQNVYFNMIAGRNLKDVKESFELDFWGLSYRKALEYILDHDPGNEIKIYVTNKPGKINAKIIDPVNRNRLRYVNTPSEATYFVTNYRWHKEEYPYPNLFYSVNIDGARILSVYKL